MDIQVFELPPIGTNAYLLINTTTSEAVLFDAPDEAFNRIQNVLEEKSLTLKALYLTHGHWDHTLDVYKFNEAGIPVYAHESDRELIENPACMSAMTIPGLNLIPGKVDHFLKDRNVIDILGETTHIAHVPGHCPGSIQFYFPKLKFAITGDTIFQGSIGRTDFPGCSFEELQESIQKKIYTLPDETTLFPGHGPQTQVAFEKSNNPFVRPC